MSIKSSGLFALIFILVATICGCGQNSVNNPTTSTDTDSSATSMDSAKSSEVSKTSDSASPSIYAVDTENDRYKKIIFSSKILNKDLGVNIYLPKGYSDKNKYPVLYILHGYSGDEDTWFPGLEMEKKADAMIQKNEINPMIMVTPMIENSYGINSPKVPVTRDNPASYFTMGNYEDYICNEIIPYIDKTYSTIASKDGRYIGGLSMGGWAALHIGFSHVDMFSKVGGHSPAIFLDGYSGNAMAFVYPNEKLRDERDPLRVAKNKDLTSLKVYLDCGDEDSYQFYQGCEQLDKILKSKGVDVQYHLGKGNHDGQYWGANVENYLKFYAGK